MDVIRACRTRAFIMAHISCGRVNNTVNRLLTQLHVAEDLRFSKLFTLPWVLVDVCLGHRNVVLVQKLACMDRCQRLRCTSH